MDVLCIPESDCCSYLSLNFLFFLSLEFSSIKLLFFSHFSQELWGLEDWNLVHTWTVGRCVVYTWIRLLLLICLFIFHFSFFPIFKHNFSSHFSILDLPCPSVILSFRNLSDENFTLFSGTVRPRRLKLGTHMDSGQMYHIYWNEAAAAHSSFYFFCFSNICS